MCRAVERGRGKRSQPHRTLPEGLRADSKDKRVGLGSTHTPLIPARRRQRRDSVEFKASLVYISERHNDIERPCLKNTTERKRGRGGDGMQTPVARGRGPGLCASCEGSLEGFLACQGVVLEAC